jgi:hypothetical protein
MKNRSYRLGTILMLTTVLLISVPPLAMVLTTLHPVDTKVLGHRLYLGQEDDDMDVTGGVHWYSTYVGTYGVTLRAWKWGYTIRIGM